MFLPRTDDSWQQWLHVSKYPPSLTYCALEMGILFLCLALLRTIEERIGVRENGVFLVFGQTAMFFYLVHRLAFEIPATRFGLRGAGDLTTTYVVAALLLLLYPACRWYRSFKAAHPTRSSSTSDDATCSTGTSTPGFCKSLMARSQMPRHSEWNVMAPVGPFGGAESSFASSRMTAPWIAPATLAAFLSLSLAVSIFTTKSLV